MHPETLLQVARSEHQQRVAEATRVVSVLRALFAQRAQRWTEQRTRQHRHEEAGSFDTTPVCCETVPRWAA